MELETVYEGRFKEQASVLHGLPACWYWIRYQSFARSTWSSEIKKEMTFSFQLDSCTFVQKPVSPAVARSGRPFLSGYKPSSLPPSPLNPRYALPYVRCMKDDCIRMKDYCFRQCRNVNAETYKIKPTPRGEFGPTSSPPLRSHHPPATFLIPVL